LIAGALLSIRVHDTKSTSSHAPLSLDTSSSLSPAPASTAHTHARRWHTARTRPWSVQQAIRLGDTTSAWVTPRLTCTQLLFTAFSMLFRFCPLEVLSTQKYSSHTCQHARRSGVPAANLNKIILRMRPRDTPCRWCCKPACGYNSDAHASAERGSHVQFVSILFPSAELLHPKNEAPLGRAADANRLSSKGRAVCANTHPQTPCRARARRYNMVRPTEAKLSLCGQLRGCWPC
jgi:hypothetical protein